MPSLFIKKKNKDLFNEILTDNFESSKNKISIEEVMGSLLITRDFFQKAEKLMKNTPMWFFYSKSDEIYDKMLKEYNETSFRIAMFDIIVKSGYILETYIKEICIFLIKGYSLKNDNIRKFYWIKGKKISQN